MHKDLKSLPDFTTLYRKYLKQRWDVYDLDFTQDKIDWNEKMTEAERQSFMAIASGFHHGERQVEIELPVFMIGASEEEKLHIAAQIEDEARHTVFFDRFYREVVGLQGDDIMDILDASFPWVSETFVGPFGLLAYQADEVRRNPYDERARVRYGTNYFLWIEGVLALSVMKVTLSYARWRGFLPAYYTGFTATCRDESRHVQGGMRYLQDAVRKDPTMINEIHETLRTILALSGVASRQISTSRWAGPRTRCGCCSSSSCGASSTTSASTWRPTSRTCSGAGAARAGGRVSRGRAEVLQPGVGRQRSVTR